MEMSNNSSRAHRHRIVSFITVLFLAYSSMAFAQGGSRDGLGGGNNDDSAPIQFNVNWLLAAGCWLSAVTVTVTSK